MKEFKASNGFRFAKTDEGLMITHETLEGAHETVFAEGYVTALREFFQHERDEEIGRWRDPENPDVVVYELPDSEWLSPGRNVWVFDEKDRIAGIFQQVTSIADGDPLIKWVARNYFVAHPEPKPRPKPWLKAKAGELWEITAKNYLSEQIVFVQVKGVGDYVFVNDVGNYWFLDAGEIVTARRVWPEGDDGK